MGFKEYFKAGKTLGSIEPMPADAGVGTAQQVRANPAVADTYELAYVITYSIIACAEIALLLSKQDQKRVLHGIVNETQKWIDDYIQQLMQ